MIHINSAHLMHKPLIRSLNNTS